MAYNNNNMPIKDFSILNKLGEGAYSSVYKVKRLSDGKQYALKKVKLNNLSEKQLENALNEVRILASIKHLNIVSYKKEPVVGFNLDSIVMQFADGGDLYQQIVKHKKIKKPFQENQIWNVLIQITRALKVLHDLKIFHRDLKSANVFLTLDGIAKLGDMNVSKMAKNGLLYTQTGTPYYACPEVWKDQPYDMKSDIWSFGCVIYEMTTLQPPFKGEDMEGLFKSVNQGSYEPISSAYSRQLGSIIKMMLQQKPSSRPNTDKLLKSALLIRKAAEINLGELQNKQMRTEMLKTIRVPRKLNYLSERLPKANYQVLKTTEDYVMSINKSLDINNSQSRQARQRKSTLPRLQGILKYHEDVIHRKAKPRINSNMLVEGRSKAINVNSYDIHQSKQSKRPYVKYQDRIHNHDSNHRVKHNSLLPPINY